MPRTPKDVSTQVEIDLLAQLNLIPAETFGSLIGLNADSERAKRIAADVWSARPPKEWSAAERKNNAELAMVSAD